MSTHLILGASGFVGTHLVSHFLNRGEQVIGVDLASSDITHPSYTFLQKDFREIPRFDLEEISVVHHCASLVPLAATHDFHRGNVEVNQELLDHLLRICPGRIVYYSSSAVACRKTFRIDPMGPQEECFPFETYGQSKYEAELLFLKACEGKLPLSILRPRTILGPGRLGLFELLFSWISQNKTIYLPASPEVPYHFIHIDDLISAVQVVIDTQSDGIFHVGTCPSQSLKGDLETLIEEKNSSSKLLWLPKGALFLLELFSHFPGFPFAPWQFRAFGLPHILDTSSLRDLGWKPKYSNLEMLSQTYDWFLDNRRESLHQSLHRRPMDLAAFRWLR